MPTFDTPGPISVIVDLVAGDVRIIAGERSDTAVEVKARNEASETDVKAAAATRIDYSDGKLTVKAAKSLQAFFTSWGGAVDVTVEVPAGSHVRANTSMGDLRGEGPMGECWFKTSTGDIRLTSTAAAYLTTSDGQIFVDRVAGESSVIAHGDVRIGAIEGKASVKNLNGDSWIGEAFGDISLNSAHGHIFVDRAEADVVARTAHGNVRVGDVARGSVVLQSASGELEVGIREGTAAWLEAKSSSGQVRNSLNIADGPEEANDTVKIRARTYDGDILIRRATK